MKKDGIQTRNRKLAAKVKKRRMQDFLQGPARFGAYGNMTPGGAQGWGNLTNQMSQYYGQMTGQMSQFMPASMHHAMTAGMMGGGTHDDPLGLQQSAVSAAAAATPAYSPYSRVAAEQQSAQPGMSHQDYGNGCGESSINASVTSDGGTSTSGGPVDTSAGMGVNA